MGRPPTITKDTSVSIGLVILLVGGIVTAFQAYGSLTANMREILVRIERIEHSILSEKRWTRENMEDWVRDASLTVGQSLPLPEAYVEKD